MEFVVAKKDFLALVERCQGAADKKSAMPILGNVLLTVDGNTLQCAATDLYLGMSGSCPSEVVSSGSLALPARDLLDRIKMMPDGPIQVTVRETQALVKAVGAARRYTLHGMPGSEFPKLPEQSTGSATLTLPIDLLSQLVARTQFSISTDETRAHVNSALFEWGGNRVRMVTTDGHRLSKVEFTLEQNDLPSTTMLLPLRGVNELRRFVAGAGGIKEITITQSGSTVFFTIGTSVFSVKTVDASFPPYAQVIPQYHVVWVTAPRGALADAVRAVSIAANDRTGGVKLTLKGLSLGVTSESPESGNGYDEVPVEVSAEVPDKTVGFNAKYLLDVLGAMTDSAEVRMSINGELDPMMVEEREGKRHQVFVLMPMRT